MTPTLRTAGLALLALSIFGCASDQPRSSHDRADAAKETAIAEMASLFKDFDQDAARQLIAPDLIQHNLTIPNGGEVLVGFIPALKDSGITATTHRVIAEGDLVVAHNTYNNARLFGGENLVSFDVFRVKDGQVVEHWDNLTPVMPPNPSGRTQTDGTAEITDHHKTAQNKALVIDFVKTILQGGEMDRITDFISTETYLQHNSQVADGLEGLKAGLAAMAEAGQPMSYTKTHFVVAEGNFVLAASEGSFGGQHVAFYDLFRVENDKIVEHWDVIQEIPTEVANDSGKF